MDIKTKRPKYKSKFECSSFRCKNEIYSRGLCRSCYAISYRAKNREENNQVFIQTRDRFKSSSEIIRNKMCMIGNCTSPVVNKGACDLHQDKDPRERYLDNDEM